MLSKTSQFDLPYSILSKWIELAKKDIIEKFNLKLYPGTPNYSSYYFIKKNTNRYFKKHLGFTYCNNFKSLSKLGTITVINAKKLMLFRLKYSL